MAQQQINEMHIGISGNCLLPSEDGKVKIDGIGTYTANLIKIYNQKNIFPTTYAFTKDPFKLINSKLQFPTYLSTVLPNFINLHQRMEEKIDIFHSTDFLIPRLKKIPVVATLHDAIVYKHPEFYKQQLRQVKNYLLKNSVRWADHTIAVSQTVVEELVNYLGIKEEKITVIHNGIDDVWFEKLPEEIVNSVLAKYQLPRRYLLFVGTLQPKKNINRIIEAYKLLPSELKQQHPLVIVGKNGWCTDEILQNIHAIENSQQGRWLQYVSFEDIRALYQSAQMLLFPSLHEGFGLPILEGFASRIPVLTSNISCMPEIAGGGAYLVDPYDIENICEGMQKLIVDGELIQQLVNEGGKRVQQFSWQRCADETLALYRRMI